jgi:HNH endonuclease
MTRTGTYHRRFMTFRERFDDFIFFSPDGCWLWTGCWDQSGYGMITVKHGLTKRAHIVSYEMFVGPVPDGLEMDHLCRVRCCVNWRHLEAVTKAENAKRSPFVLSTIHAKKTHCIYGHPLSGDNLAVQFLKNGHKYRSCMTCRRRYVVERRAKISLPKEAQFVG